MTSGRRKQRSIKAVMEIAAAKTKIAFGKVATVELYMTPKINGCDREVISGDGNS